MTRLRAGSVGCPAAPKNKRRHAWALALFALLGGALLPAAAQPRQIRFVDATNVTGEEASLVVQFVAQGNENALGFSVLFDTNLVAWHSAALGANGLGSALNLNTSQVALGRVGLAVARPAGQRFSAGTNELLRLRFGVGATPGTATLSFGDQPISRETVDDDASVLTTVYADGALTITPLIAPLITVQPLGQTVQPITNVVTNVTFSVTAEGSAPLRYQWRWNGANLPGVTSTTLTLGNVAPANSGQYDVVVTNNGGAATSHVAVLTVLPPLIPPVILAQPRSQVVSTGETVKFSVAASGSSPLSYQWLLNSSDLGGQTNDTLTLSNVTTAQGGNYGVRVSNGGGSATSANALLTVKGSPRVVRIASREAATGRIIDLPVELVSFGDENSVGFSLTFVPSQLRYVGASLGSGASGCLLNLNTNQVSTGRLGVALSKQAGVTFTAGTQTVLNVRFQVGDFSGTNLVGFGDSPILRELADVEGDARPVDFQPGYVNILNTAPGITVAPQSQVVQIFASPVFQVVGSGSAPLYYQWRLNGVPIAGANDSVLALSNVLPAQAGYYDVVITNAVASTNSPVATLTVQRVVRVGTTNAPTGNPTEVPVHLLAAGDENSIGFSLRFDPALLQFREAVLPAGVSNLTLNVNSNPAASGVVGLSFAKPAAQTFVLGTQQVAVLRFAATTTPGSAGITFQDAPIMREIADANADSKDAVFLGNAIGTANVSPQITQHPVPRDVDLGQIVAFGVTASGSFPMTYQWQKNGSPISGATNSLLNLGTVKTSDAGNYAAEVRNVAGVVYSSNALLTVILPDTNGPVLSFARYGITPLADGLVLTNSDTLSVIADDPSGVSRVEFLVYGNLLAADSNPSDGFSTLWNLELATDGSHSLVIKATDMRNNITALSNQVVVALVPPPAPVIGLPVSGAIFSDPLITVRGTGPKDASVAIYRNGTRIGTPVPVPGSFVLKLQHADHHRFTANCQFVAIGLTHSWLHGQSKRPWC